MVGPIVGPRVEESNQPTGAQILYLSASPLEIVAPEATPAEILKIVRSTT
jgi:hypothetical protein